MFHKTPCNCRAINYKQKVKNIDPSNFKIDEADTNVK